ncbi:MAG: hypothetical protein A3K19_32390 [Lentisphaerae bacterium RIFOXYB12_FULL_65_16]|nr:MAG: hypothetical protein A3K18_11895 [Lentisphaerae bacterium RIFOXYA12_64_32]OGV85718.1 MAG: hypothetical protein A3K19_32390 [Lentisphaerae bacterium RIFOXYB12_FULL_65_16]
MDSERTNPESPGTRATRLRNLPLVTLAVLALVVYIGALIVHNYTFHLDLRRRALESLVSELERQATTVAYFFSERRNDVRNLLERHEIQAYFQNQDLGMSNEYGLDLSLAAIRERLRTFVDASRIGTDRLYSRVIFLGADGRPLADAPRGLVTYTPDIDWTTFLQPNAETPELVTRVDSSGRLVLIVSAPCRFKGRYSGQLLAWLRPEVLGPSVLREKLGGDRFTFLVLGDDAPVYPTAMADVFLPYIRQICDLPVGEPVRFRSEIVDGTPRPMLGLRLPVDKTDFFLVKGVAVDKVFARVPPWELPLAMGLLAVILISGIGLVLHSRVQTAILEAHLQEAAAQHRALEEKNVLLEKQIAERRLLATAVHQSAEAIIITLTDGTIQYVNPAFERITGYSAAEVLGRNPRILKSGRNSAAFYAQMWEVLRRGDVWSGQLSNRRKDGTIYEEVALISPVRDESGAIVNYVAVKRDVTKQLAMEAQLRQSQKMEAVGALAGGVAHDLNNLLTVILGNCTLLTHRETPLGKDFSDQVQEIMKAGERGASLIRQLLAFSRYDEVKPEVLDLNVVIGNAERFLRRLIRADIEFDIRPAPGQVLVEIDPVQMDQIIMNLAVNARDAMPRGGRFTLAVSTVRITEEETGVLLPFGEYAVLEVSDTGCGMDEETQARIFEPFFTTKKDAGGTGLGLATVYGIVQQCRGDIQLISQVGVGTSFIILLPRITTKMPTPKRREKPEPIPRAHAEESDGHHTVLVVDDEISILTVMQRALEAKGYTVHTAADDQACMKVWGQFHGQIQLLITDLVMPRVNGKELADGLLSAKPDLKVIYMSAYSDPSIIQMDPRAPGLVFLRKPFTPEELLTKVRTSLGILESVRKSTIFSREL